MEVEASSGSPLGLSPSDLTSTFGVSLTPPASCRLSARPGDSRPDMRVRDGHDKPTPDLYCLPKFVCVYEGIEVIPPTPGDRSRETCIEVPDDNILRYIMIFDQKDTPYIISPVWCMGPV